jgi:hypothetical protein
MVAQTSVAQVSFDVIYNALSIQVIFTQENERTDVVGFKIVDKLVALVVREPPCFGKHCMWVTEQ